MNSYENIIHNKYFQRKHQLQITMKLNNLDKLNNIN